MDASRIGVTGHSNGALACREAVLQDEEGLIAAALLVSNDAVYYDESGAFYNQFGSRDAAIVACQYDEFFHRVDENPPREYICQITAQSFLHFGADPAGLKKRVPETFYTQEVDGKTAIRAIYNPAITHPWAHFSGDVVAFSVTFFDKALGAPASLPANDQIWQWKAAFNVLGVVGFFMFVGAAALAMLDTPYFADLKADAPVMPWPALEGKVAKRYWRNGFLGAALSIPFYFIAFILGMVLSPPIWNQGPSRIIGIRRVLCGLFTWFTLRSKKYPVDHAERGIAIEPPKLLKFIVLALAVVGASFALVFLSDYLFLTDYRLWCFATIRAFSADHIPMILAFVPFWLVYYIVTSVSSNCCCYVQMGKSSRTGVVWQMFFAALGPVFMIAAQYIIFFITGKMVLDPLTGLMGIWLIPIAIILPLSVYISHLIYRKTKNPYIGGILMGIIACILTVTNTLTG